MPCSLTVAISGVSLVFGARSFDANQQQSQIYRIDLPNVTLILPRSFSFSIQKFRQGVFWLLKPLKFTMLSISSSWIILYLSIYTTAFKVQ